MREGQFIKRNLKRWEHFQEDTDDPDEVARRFTYLVDDLSYAKTFYPSSKTVSYINSIAANIYLSIYKNKKEKRNRLATFWKTEVPLAMRRNHRVMLFTLLFFLTFIAMGVYSAWHDQTFIRAILGDSYVSMTEQNIADGKPFGVYANDSEMAMFLQIAFHNITVTLLCYILGLTAGVFTLWFLFRNGLMVGVFEYMFFHHNLGAKSLLVIFTHGTFELSGLVIAGGCGLMLGNSLLFPGTYTRLQSLRFAARDSIRIIISLIPVFIVAAFFEGYVTRHTDMPIWLNLLILIASASWITWYYIIYPIRLSKKIKPDAPQL